MCLFIFVFSYRFSTGEEDILSVEYSKQSLENYQMGEACRKGSSVIRDFSVNYEERVVSKQVIKKIHINYLRTGFQRICMSVIVTIAVIQAYG